MQATNAILALDVGGQRIGVARANALARIASPLITLQHDDRIVASLTELVQREDAAVLVVGLPRGLQGQETEQTQTIRAFVAKLESALQIPLYWQDEALTSQKAEAELKARRKPYAKGDIDALAATYILEDFLRDHPEIGVGA